MRQFYAYTVFLIAVKLLPSLLAFCPPKQQRQTHSFALFDSLQKTAQQLDALKKLNPRTPTENHEDALYRQYMLQSANSLKQELSSRGLPVKGRKPDLAKRLVDSDLQTPPTLENENESIPTPDLNTEVATPLSRFAGLKLSHTAGLALAQANFVSPSPIQAAAIPLLANGESVILHAETGSGKTLAYLLPMTEQLWQEDNNDESFFVVMTPTRELAAQVAGIATVLAPPGSVRLVSHPTNLLKNPNKDRGENPEMGGRSIEEYDGPPRLVVGSAKSIMVSLYGDKKLPAPPTSKPEAMTFLQNTRTVVMDEVDRLLNIQKSRAASQKKLHEKPAAIVTSAVTRLTLGQCQVVCASATVGRPLRREVARVLGLPAQDCPQVIRGNEIMKQPKQQQQGSSTSRAVTIPNSVENFVLAVDGSTVGKLLTSAFYVIKSLPKDSSKQILLVLTRGCGVNTQNAIGALRHFGCKPNPQSLLDALEADGTDNMIEVHRQVLGATGVGESYFSNNGQSEATDGNDTKEYLLVTGEDTVRGLHLDGLDMVIVVGRPNGPDEYTHIAGRTGRAGRRGKVVTVVSEDNAAALKSWERMLNVRFEQLDMDNVATSLT